MRTVFTPELINGPFGDPAVLVRIAHRGEALLFDCGDLARLGQRQRLKVRAVFISHHHVDHVAGFTSLLRSFLHSDRQLLVCGPPGTIRHIGHHLAAITWDLTAGYPFVLEVREWGDPEGCRARFRADRGFVSEPTQPHPCPGGVLHATAGWQVRAMPLSHGAITSLAFRLEEPLHVAIHGDALQRRGWLPGPWLGQLKDQLRSGADDRLLVQVPRAAGGHEPWTVAALMRELAHIEPGQALAYVTDANPDRANARRILALAREVGQLLIEATFADCDHQLARERHHLTARLAGALGRRAGVRRLQVFHHSPRYQKQPQRLQQEAREAFTGGKSG